MTLPGDAERPTFAASFPDDARLRLLLSAFARGDFGAVRKGAPALIAASGSEEVRRAAADLLARTRPDPRAAALFALTAALLVFLSAYWWWTTRP